MTKNINEQELNKKLAEWAGIETIPMEKIHYDHTTEIIDELPSFTQSLDACFKWLVPKLEEEITFYYQPFSGKWGCYLGRDYQRYFLGDEPALALCLAVEKLIDEVVK